jgi:alpha/beta superfamily hydrolase
MAMRGFFIPALGILMVLTACARGETGAEVIPSDALGGGETHLEVEPVNNPVAGEVYTEPALAEPTEAEEPDPTIEIASPGAISFSDGQTIRYGVLYGEGPIGIILVHMGDHECGHRMDQRSWQAFAERLSEEGYRVLIYDARGYGVRVGGYITGRGVLESLEGAVDFMRQHGGVEQIVIIGAGMGGTVGIRFAAEDEIGDIAGLAVISSWQYAFVTETSFAPISEEELAALTMPTLWIVGSDDDRVDNTQEMFDLATRSNRRLIVYESTDVRGTDLLDQPEYGPRLEADLLAFVAEAASPAR